MRFYHRILLVMALTLGIIAAGVAWERLYVSALVEQAQRTPDRPDSVAADLPAECLEELSTMGSSAMVEEPRSELPAFTGQETFGDPSSTAGNNVVRSGDAKPVSTEIGFVDPAPSLALVEGDAATRPIQRAQSAEWNAPVADPRVERSSLAGALPASAEETMRQYDLRDGLKSADVLDLMRRLRGDDGEQRAEARRELVRRRFSEVDLDLARQLFSPDVEIRKQLARAVPRLSSVDAAKWLLWLALDPQPEVRLPALTTLATTGDPALLDRVETLARNDHDAQIQALAAQIAKQRELASRRGDPTEPGGGMR